jgi:lipopolysaccharide/colanic/teichoic acid biosynthesis glycosyltransferase
MQGDGVARDGVVRRLLDIVLAAGALLVLAPLFAAVALAVRIESPGPAIFRQQRLGRGRRPFTVLKFRTMRHEADPMPHREYVRSLIARAAGSATEAERSTRELAGSERPRESVGCGRSAGALAGAERGGLYKLSVDDRVTRVGRLLRSWSVDELPQLVNVLRGEMALVGPRPVVPYEVEHYPESYLGRFAVKPGLTGLWQVSGRNERTYDEMVRFDIEYAQRASLMLDLRILARTLPVVLGRQGVA